jgi:hypothetical protein
VVGEGRQCLTSVSLREQNFWTASDGRSAADLQKMGGAKVILATGASNKTMDAPGPGHHLLAAASHRAWRDEPRKAGARGR